MGVVEQIAEHHVRRPLALLRPYAESYTGYHYAGFEPGVHMGLPSRHVTFIISFDDRLELTVLPDGRHRPTTFDAMVGGLHTTPAVIRHDGNQHGIQLHLTPAGARGAVRTAGRCAGLDGRAARRRCGAAGRRAARAPRCRGHAGPSASPCSSG